MSSIFSKKDSPVTRNKRHILKQKQEHEQNKDPTPLEQQIQPSNGPSRAKMDLNAIVDSVVQQPVFKKPKRDQIKIKRAINTIIPEENYTNNAADEIDRQANKNTPNIIPLVNEVNDEVVGNETVSGRIITNNEKNFVESISDRDADDYNDDNGGQMILTLEQIRDRIPKTAIKKSNNELQETHVEFRWRFFNLKGRKLVEISKKAPNKNRIYVDNTGKWTEFDLKGNWEQFQTDARYYYASPC